MYGHTCVSTPPATLWLHMKPPNIGPTKRAAELTVCARPWASGASAGGVAELSSTMTDVNDSTLASQRKLAAAIIPTITKRSLFGAMNDRR